ncbi:MAG: prolyl-tRNA synthetase associated domain-containing protein [Acidobacteriota bacterium]
MSDPRRVYEVLDQMGIHYEKYEHPPVFTGEDAAAYWGPIPATRVKNLFLRNKKGDRHYLAILEISKQADLRQLVKVIGDDRLSFGSAERLMAHLGVTPGSVSPFGLIHEGSAGLQVIVDEDLRGAERLIFHPNINTASVTVSVPDLERFLASRPNRVRWLRL